MPDRLVLWTIVGFGLVVGSMAFVRFRRRRAAASIDDESILLAAPPEGMTPAVAALVDGAQVHLAFLAALLDLASRGEIGFVVERVRDGVADVGVAIGGGDSTDPRVQQNRRQPAGEAEVWLLGQLEMAAVHPRHGPWDQSALASGSLPFLIGEGASVVGAMLREGALSPEDQGSPAATAAREHGLLSEGPVDPETIARAYEAQTGHPLPEGASQLLSAMAPPDAASPVAPADGAGTPADGPETAPAAAGPGTAPDPATPGGADPATPGGVGRHRYIRATDARSLPTPMFFGTFLETYARRHGWLGSMPVITRLRWRIAGVIAAGAGIVVMSAGVEAYSDPGTGLGLGLFFGGLAAFALAPAMVQPSVAGGRVRAQLAAYRRTLLATFRSATSIGDAVGPTGLRWLSTPDQAIAWGVALGLAPDIESLLTRSAPDAPGTAADAPAWYRPQRRGGAAAGASVGPDSSPGAVFAGIEAIGGGAGRSRL